MSLKKIVLSSTILVLFLSCSTSRTNELKKNDIIVTKIDLVNIENDRVKIDINPGKFYSTNTSFFIPKVVPGTYSADNYGQYIEDFRAYDYNGKQLKVSSKNINVWFIEDAKNLDRITYYVNDTYDTETEKVEPVFSPAGTNIDQNKNFVLNLHGFVGYFEGLQEIPYELQISSPEQLRPSTSLTKVSNGNENGLDTFKGARYFDIIDNPIMYSPTNSTTFDVNGISVSISVYSPNNKYSANDFRPSMEKMMNAQKEFLGSINGTSKYNILLYLSEVNKEDATGFGALEHHTSTLAVLPEQMSLQDLEETLIDLVSHEFFHIVTPLNVHSKEIQYFSFNEPIMSKHLWMYEGTTEYFANLFQIQQNLIDEKDFLDRISEKMNNSALYDDDMSFTAMSENVLSTPYKENYGNVYEKGALISMCLDILLRDLSDGEYGVLWLMKELSLKYDHDTPFEDDEIIKEITKMTFPQIGAFFADHVVGNTPIDYEEILKIVGLEILGIDTETSYFFDGEEPYIDVRPGDENSIFIREGIVLNSFFHDLGAQSGDTIKSIDGIPISLESIGPIIGQSFQWRPNRDIEMVVERSQKEINLQGQVGIPLVKVTQIVPLEGVTEKQLNLKNLWLKGAQL
ncbi:MAG: peptidase M61 [Eudoraea sp.]|uniref:M61 family metallopeptidase n=1 Tax=Eudoraea sp. TaxID=1979955 RepID=UPI003C73492B